jgi:hypothetical protein
VRVTGRQCENIGHILTEVAENVRHHFSCAYFRSLAVVALDSRPVCTANHECGGLALAELGAVVQNFAHVERMLDEAETCVRPEKRPSQADVAASISTLYDQDIGVWPLRLRRCDKDLDRRRGLRPI